MADYFYNRRGDRGDFNNNGDRRDGGYEGRQNNNFDRRYTGGRDGVDYFAQNDNRATRATRATDDNFNRSLPPIADPFAQAQQQSMYQSVSPQYQPAVQQYPQGAAPISTVPQGQSVVFPIQNVSLFSPKNFNDVQVLIDHLRNHEPEIVELSGVDDENGQRMLDFLSGAIYALGGSMQKISASDTIFLLTPTGVSISSAIGDISKSIEEKRKRR